MMTVEETFKLAVTHHDARRLSQAQSLYRQVLLVDPHHALAMRMLGLLALETGNPAEAVNLLRQALLRNPEMCEWWGNLGIALAALGQLPEAVEAFQKAYDLRPNDADCCSNLASALQQSGKLDEAIDLYRIAVKLAPDAARLHFKFAQALYLKQNLNEAIASYRHAIALRPNDAESFLYMGAALCKNNEASAAIDVIQQALRLRPDFPEALDHLGTALHSGGRSAEAIAAYQRAIELRPGFPESYNNLANVLLSEDRLEEAEQNYRKAIALRPDYADALSNLGTAIQRQGRFKEAKETYKRATEVDPSHAAAQFNYAWALLQAGDFERGWELHDARLQIEEGLRGRRFTQPLWDGSPLHGKRILLHAEQGMGDTIQFVRYAPWVASMGAVVFVETQAPLKRLLQSLPGVAQVISRGEPLPEFDFHCPLMSLPRRHGTTLQSVPREVPYLRADRETRRQGDSEMSPVGVVWSGNPAHTRDRHRSIPSDLLAPLLEVPGVQFHSLQKGPAANELIQFSIANCKLQIANSSASLSDFADTAALIMNLDLVISVDTAVAHLAGALAKPVWVLLPFIPDWRWMLNCTDSPWYPTMRLFRQPRAGDWQTVIAQAASELKCFVSQRSP